MTIQRDPTYLLMNETSLVKNVLSQAIWNRSEYQHWCWLIDEITNLDNKEFHSYMEKHGGILRSLFTYLSYGYNKNERQSIDKLRITNTYNILKRLTDTIIFYT